MIMNDDDDDDDVEDVDDDDDDSMMPLSDEPCCSKDRLGASSEFHSRGPLLAPGEGCMGKWVLKTSLGQSAPDIRVRQVSTIHTGEY